ncbi:MAG: 16S rRNA (cytidine(1402)-2'-O)-methyltransferase [Patescibacteria group bacterium]
MALYVVATPIGNLSDITFRAVKTLKEADLVAAEDTRTAQKLFTNYDIHTPLTSFHAHSSEKKVGDLIEKMKAGKTLALISEAGTPGISDPGFVLIRKAVEEGIEVVPIPGASAVITALSASGLPTDKFLYLGFLPLKKGRRKLLESLREEKRTVVFYESPHRILKTVSELTELLGNERKIVLARELTKLYEEFFRGSIPEAVKFLESKPIKGEFTVLLSGAN